VIQLQMGLRMGRKNAPPPSEQGEMNDRPTRPIEDGHFRSVQ
jgi:hypothetical protein